MKAWGLLLLGLSLAGCGGLAFTRGGDARRQAEQLVARAEDLSRAGKYPEAEQTYRQVVDQSATDSPADRALYGLARLQVAPDNPTRDYRQAQGTFERLLREHPQSSWSPEARAWRDALAALQAQREEALAARREAERFRQDALRSRQDAQRIRQDLERLKQLELELERQRRR